MKRRRPSSLLAIATPLAALVLLVAAPLLPARAQDTPPAPQGGAIAFPGTAARLDSALAGQLRTLVGTPLGLEAAVELALLHSAEVGQAAARLRAAESAARRERGAFDPEVYAEAERTGSEEPTTSPFAGSRADEFTAETGAHLRLPTGTELDASFRSTRRGTNAPFNTVDPTYDARSTLELRQPLLEGGGPAARVERTAAEFDLAAARADHDGTLLAVRSQVVRLYWDLYAAERDLAVERLVRDGAAALRESAERRARAGLVGPNQVANARTFLAQQETAVLDAEERLDGTSDRLASLLGRRPDAGSPRFRPTVEPPRDFDLAPQDSVVALALRRNHALRVLEGRVAALAARARAAGRDALPTLDLTGSLGFAGLGGRGRTVTFGDTTIPNDLDTGVGEAWRQVFEGDFPTWSIGLRFAMGLGRRQTTGERDRRRAEVVVGEQQQVAARRGLDETVRARCRELEHARQRLAVAEDGVDASFEQARIGRLEFESGRTTAFELVRLAGDLAAAQLRYSQALVRAAQAAAALHALTGGMYPAAK